MVDRIVEYTDSDGVRHVDIVHYVDPPFTINKWEERRNKLCCCLIVFALLVLFVGLVLGLCYCTWYV